MSTPSTTPKETPKDETQTTPKQPSDASTEQKAKDNNVGTDSELDAILESALADFDKPAEVKPSTKPAGASSGDTNGAAGKLGGESAEGDGSTADEMNYDFLADAMTKQFEECFGSLINDPAVKKQFEDLSKSAEEAASSNNPAAFTETVEKALSGMSLNAENLQAEPNQQDMWEEIAQSLAGDGTIPGAAGMPGGDLGDLASLEKLGGMGGMFQTMVQQLLSKEMLYQPLKEVSEKYHEYLDKNADTLEAQTLSNYRKQLEIVEKVVLHLDGESDDLSAEQKNVRFEELLELLQKMHELGNPPKEVVGEGNMMMPGMPDLASMGGMAGGMDPSKCPMM